MAFDVESARKSGYSDSEIADYLAGQSNFDSVGARQSGYTDSDIIKHLSRVQTLGTQKATATDRAQAVASGGYAGIAGVLGAPVDTLLNAVDLVKMPAGIAYSELTGKAVPKALEPFDRNKYVASSDWIKSKINRTGLPTSPARPDDTASQLLHLGANVGTGMFLGRAIPGEAASAPVNPPPISSASASAAATPGVASAQNVVSVNPTVTARGGGYNFGSVGDDAINSLTEAQRRIIERGRGLGMRLTPGQATGNKLLQRLEAKLESQPMTAGPFDKIKDANQKALNREWAKSIGETTDNVDSVTLERAATRIGQVFDDVRDETVRSINPQQFVSTMRGISDEFEAIAPQVWKNPLVERLVRHAESGGATGKDLGSLTSKLGREAHKHLTSQGGDRELGQALYRIKDYVDDMVEQGLSGGRLVDYQAARREYRNLSLLTSRVNTVNPSTGNVSGVSLANLLQQKDKSGFLFGRNQTGAYDASRFAQAFKPIVGDSGTATRQPLTSTIDLILQSPMNIASRAYASSPSVYLATQLQQAANQAGRAGAYAADATGATSPLGLLFGAQSTAGLLDDYRGR